MLTARTKDISDRRNKEMYKEIGFLYREYKIMYERTGRLGLVNGNCLPGGEHPDSALLVFVIQGN
jgi:hypothetical protein